MSRIKLYTLATTLIMMLTIIGCGDDEGELMATISVNETGDTFGGDVTGDGGSTSESFTWTNNLTTADYNMDITSAAGGSMNISITDAQGASVLNQTLTAGQGDDSRSGVTSSGASGDWTVVITLTEFDGDGSFSLSPGD